MKTKDIIAIVMLILGTAFGVVDVLYSDSAYFVLSSVWIVGAIILAWMPERKS